MRVLWFTNDPLPAVGRRIGRNDLGSGHWMTSLLSHLAGNPAVEIGVATAHPGLKDDEFQEDGVKYLTIRQRRRQQFFSHTNKDLEACARLVREYKPDLVHFHGSERFFGLLAARKLIAVPSVISIQGLLEPYLACFFGALSPMEIWRSQRLIELGVRRGLLWRYLDFAAGARQEREILTGAHAFMGRTHWDRMHAAAANPSAKYYHVGEILRSAFSQTSWMLPRCDRHTVIFTHAGDPRRGTEVLLNAMQIVRRDFPDAKLRLGGGVGKRRGYDRFLRRTLVEKGLSEITEFLGYLDATAMAAQLSRAHMFVMPSFIENSSNSLCEAMQVGMPCVATYSGGTPSIVDHERSGLLVPPGDAPLLAHEIVRIFRDDNFASGLGHTARVVASERHDPNRVVSQLLSAYDDIASNNYKSRQKAAAEAVQPRELASSYRMPANPGA